MNPQNKTRPHAELIHAWADGATIQVKVYRKQEAPTWADIENPPWSEDTFQTWCSDTPIAFLTSSLGGISKDIAIIAALKQIQKEQEASRED